MPTDSRAEEAALGDVRVLDLSGALGAYCSKLLADLGADVIRVEPPEGDAMRRLGPFYHDDPSIEKSLLHFVMNANKRGITLNLEHPDGAAILRRLTATADVVVETFTPGYLDSLGLGYEALHALNPRLVLTSITPFGQTGPLREVPGPNIVGEASGGLLYVSGLPDGPPLVSADQGYYMASIQAAIGTVMALIHRDSTGEGDHVDASMQEAIATTVQPQAMFWPSRHEVPGRSGHGPRTATDNIFRDTVHRCKDGWVVGLGAQDRSWPEVVAWLEEEGAAEDLADPRYLDGSVRAKEFSHVHDVIARFAAMRTMDELSDGGQARHIFIMPMYTSKNVANDAHLESRSFFHAVEHAELAVEIRYPGPPYIFSETPARIRRRAPFLGEHNTEIYMGELGMAAEKLPLLKVAGAI